MSVATSWTLYFSTYGGGFLVKRAYDSFSEIIGKVGVISANFNGKQ